VTGGTFTVSVTVSDDDGGCTTRSFVARNVIEGDVNSDCKVNVLDLIFIRDRFGTDCETGDNWQANVNGDGNISILDLIYVRNRLNDSCP